MKMDGKMMSLSEAVVESMLVTVFELAYSSEFCRGPMLQF
jgi:hypothetical protein